MKQTLQLKLGQSLVMTPQLQQAIRLLQLSSLELHSEIQETLEKNPLLEEESVEDTAAQEVEKSEREKSEGSASDSKSQAEALAEVQADTAISSDQIEVGDQDQVLPDELPVDSAWEDVYDGATSYSAPAADSYRDPFESQSGGGDNLIDHLLSQLHLLPLNQTDALIGMAIIEAIGSDGYIATSLEDIQQGLNNTLPHEEQIETDEIKAVLHLVQQFDPLGVAARDLGESLHIQLKALPEDTPHRDTAITLVSNHLNLMATHDFKQLKRKLRVSDKALSETVHLLQSLNPRPGAQLSAQQAEYVIPDVFVKKLEDSWRVTLNPDIAPKLGINNTYASLVKRADTSDDNTYIKNQLQEARWFIKSLLSRNETLMKVATVIVQRQRAFLEYGDEAMKPMVLRDIAEELDMHESTISRVTTQKYMHTPSGIYEFKYFFSSHVSTADGGECSAIAIRAMLKKLVAEEPSDKPYSDNKIAAVMVERGINVARRTVAKYRESLSIPPSNERKRL